MSEQVQGTSYTNTSGNNIEVTNSLLFAAGVNAQRGSQSLKQKNPTQRKSAKKTGQNKEKTNPSEAKIFLRATPLTTPLGLLQAEQLQQKLRRKELLNEQQVFLNKWGATAGARINSVKTESEFMQAVDKFREDTANTLRQIREKGGDNRKAANDMKNYIQVKLDNVPTEGALVTQYYAAMCLDKTYAYTIELPGHSLDDDVEKYVEGAKNIESNVISFCNDRLTSWARYIIEEAYQKTAGKSF